MSSPPTIRRSQHLQSLRIRTALQTERSEKGNFESVPVSSFSVIGRDEPSSKDNSSTTPSESHLQDRLRSADHLTGTSQPLDHSLNREVYAPEDISGLPQPGSNDVVVGGSVALGAIALAVILGASAAGFVYRDDINTVVTQLAGYVEGAGPIGYVFFALGYAALEVLAIPAIPLTMSAGILFGPVIGTTICSVAGTIAAAISFLIARYLARDRVLELVKDNPKFLAIDRAIGDKSFRVVTILRLSPLLPFSLGNYVYGLTSVKLLPYILGSCIGMLPGTWAYVSAGSFGRTLLAADSSETLLNDSSLTSLVLGVVAAVAAATYVTSLAKDALKDVDEQS